MEKFYITTAIDYANARPHIGHALEKIQADVLARYHRSVVGDKNVLFLTGTDEHGAKVARAAALAHKDPKLYVDEISEEYRNLKGALNLSWDDFIRTTDEMRRWPGAAMLWRTLMKKGDIYKKKYQGLYCVGHEAFVTQKDLMNGKCADHEQEPEIIEEENYFFRLSKYSEDIRVRIQERELRIVPESRAEEMLSFITQGLEDVSFSRPRKDLSWGIPVPDDPTQTMYVWCDALVNYISAIGYGSVRDEDILRFRKWWPADAQIIGKDILRFHAAIWPAMLLAAGLPLPSTIFVHGFITVEGKKMSKTIGNIVDPFSLRARFSADAIRYYLLREIPSYEDGDFSLAKFKDRYNGDLANGLGNFAARVLVLAETHAPITHDEMPFTLSRVMAETKTEIASGIHEFRFHEALRAIWRFIGAGDAYLSEKKPWEDRNEKVLFHLVTLLDTLAVFLAPFLPETSEKIVQCITKRGNTLSVKKREALFPRVG